MRNWRYTQPQNQTLMVIDPVTALAVLALAALFTSAYLRDHRRP